MATPDKVAAVKEIAEQFRNSDAVIVTEYRGLSVPQLAQLRSDIRGAATYSVAKNTLTALAAKEAGVEGLDDLFVGPTAIAFITGDPVEAAKGLKEFSKDNENLVIKGGLLEGKVISAEEINKLADLESREVLLAKAAGAIKASLVNAAYLFQAPLSKTARTVDALRAKQEDAA
ncbi:50S ribosomal protein L10 [Demequina sediminicola]|uniref:50S ribosomal protein L10 n=1 Tax=Demequina sediminicola TaxID=1095026 RepID=UPI000781E633|nr:50S ribosomal protein L10 [Demequina sediminicola]